MQVQMSLLLQSTSPSRRFPFSSHSPKPLDVLPQIQPVVYNTKPLMCIQGCNLLFTATSLLMPLPVPPHMLEHENISIVCVLVPFSNLFYNRVCVFLLIEAGTISCHVTKF